MIAFIVGATLIFGIVLFIAFFGKKLKHFWKKLLNSLWKKPFLQHMLD